MKYEVILFDLDGTLTDTALGIIRSVRFALSKFGISEDSDEKLMSFIGAPLLIFFKEHYSLSKDDARRAVDFYRERYSEAGVRDTSVYPGITALLKELTGTGKRLIIATLKPDVYAEKVLKHFELRDFFEDVFAPDLEALNRTKADIIRDALAAAPGVPKQSVVMVGDREHDIIGAASNGIDSIAVTYGYGTIEELQQADPKYTINSVEELRALLDSSR